jgi:hypothetical protein
MAGQISRFESLASQAKEVDNLKQQLKIARTVVEQSAGSPSSDWKPIENLIIDSDLCLRRLTIAAREAS